MMIADVEPERWDRLLAEAGLHDPYLTSGWLEAAAVLERGTPARLCLEGERGRVLFPCILRPLPEGAPGLDCTTPYGYGGPLVAGEAPPLEEFRAAYERWCRERRVLTTFLRFHPLYQNAGCAPEGAVVEPLAGVVLWDVSAGRDLLAGMTHHVRRAVRHGEKSGLQFRATPGPADLGSFRAVYETTMRRREAQRFYFFPDEHWRILRERCAERIIIFDTLLEGEVLSTVLALAGGPILHVHLAASTDRGLKADAARPLFHEIARWSQARGLRHVNLGGGVGGKEDSLFTFKQRFSPANVVPSHIGKVVHDAARYRELAGRDDVAGWFPAYRAPAAPARKEREEVPG